MEITLKNVDEVALSPLIVSYENRIREQKSIAQKAMQKAKNLMETLSQLKYARVQTHIGSRPDIIEYPQRKSKKIDFDAGFSISWSLSKKIQYILTKFGKEHPLTSKEITERLMVLEPNIDRDKTFKNVSTILSIGNGKNFKRIDGSASDSRGRREYLYFLN